MARGKLLTTDNKAESALCADSTARRVRVSRRKQRHAGTEGKHFTLEFSS